MIVFLPPKIDREIAETTKSFQISANVYINRVHKQKNLIVYEILFDVIENEWSRLESLYDQLLLTPLPRLDYATGLERIHVFVVVWSVTGDLDPRLPFCMVEVFDFIFTQRRTLKLWRRLSSWSRVLQAGDCIQVRDLNVTGNGTILQSTNDTQIFLLSSPQPSKQLSTRFSHLNSAELEILQFLKKKALICPIQEHRCRVEAFLPVALSKEVGQYWCLYGHDQRKIIFKVMEASTWIKLQDLIETGFKAEIGFERLSPDLEFIKDSLMTMKQNLKAPVGSIDLQSLALGSNTIFHGLIRIRGILRLHHILHPDDATLNTLNASLSTSQPDRLLLAFPPDQQLILDNSEWQESWLGKIVECLLSVKTVTEDDDDDMVIRKSFILLDCN